MYTEHGALYGMAWQEKIMRIGTIGMGICTGLRTGMGTATGMVTGTGMGMGTAMGTGTGTGMETGTGTGKERFIDL